MESLNPFFAVAMCSGFEHSWMYSVYKRSGNILLWHSDPSVTNSGYSVPFVFVRKHKFASLNIHLQFYIHLPFSIHNKSLTQAFSARLWNTSFIVTSLLMFSCFACLTHKSCQGYFCSTRIVFIYDFATDIDKRWSVHWVFLDFSTAFDVALHDLSMSKFRLYTVDDKLCKLVYEWYYLKKQDVVFNGFQSKTVDATSCILQSSWLWPLLFPICINDVAVNVWNWQSSAWVNSVHKNVILEKYCVNCVQMTI